MSQHYYATWLQFCLIIATAVFVLFPVIVDATRVR
jgi:hypothetical protein